MVIEWLKVKVPPALRAKYIQKDAEIWTKVLAQYPGFLTKEVWINPKDDSEVIMVIHWHDRASWKAVPGDVLQATERKFTAAMGQAFPFAEAGEYQIVS